MARLAPSVVGACRGRTTRPAHSAESLDFFTDPGARHSVDSVRDSREDHGAMLATGCLRLVRQSFTAHAPPGAEIDESAVDVNGFAAYGARPIMGLCQGCKPGAQLLGNGSAIIFFHRRLLKKVGESWLASSEVYPAHQARPQSCTTLWRDTAAPLYYLLDNLGASAGRARGSGSSRDLNIRESATPTNHPCHYRT